MPEGTAERNRAACLERGIPFISEAKRGPLAIVAGGPSVAGYVDELRHWPGDVWVCGSAFQWALSQGIDGAFFNIDQHPSLASDCRGARKAVVATVSDPSVFDELRSADVEVFDLDGNHYATSAASAAFKAVQMGYVDVTFYGCDSSYRHGRHTFETHAYESDYWQQNPDTLLAVCGGRGYFTNPGFLVQAEFLAALCRLFPSIFRARSDGLIAALVDDPEYDITAGSKERANFINSQIKDGTVPLEVLTI